jgi:hypothetical protein
METEETVYINKIVNDIIKNHDLGIGIISKRKVIEIILEYVKEIKDKYNGNTN